MDNPIVRKKPINTLNLSQVDALLCTPQTDQELAILHLLVGHGWRQIEVRRVTAGDVGGVKDGQIWCRGKERDEWTPILPETQELLERLAVDKGGDDILFLGNRKGRPEPFGETGIAHSIARLFEQARIEGFKGHDLRRTFVTMVTEASGDELLGMRLARDRVPGVNDRYVKRDLVVPLARFSPIRQAGSLPVEKNGTPPSGQTGESALIAGGDGGGSKPTATKYIRETVEGN